MRVLVVKTSSLGDVVHTLPALTDACRAIPDIRFDWVVEEAFAEIPKWHSGVDRVIPVAIRRWRKTLLKSLLDREWRDFIKQLRSEKYDYIIDAQGLLKSGILTRIARGTRIGLNKESLTEPMARFFYQKTVNVDLQKHAVWRMRSIFAQALGYDFRQDEPDFGISRQRLLKGVGINEWIPRSSRGMTEERSRGMTEERSRGMTEGKKYVVFLHGTTWQTKLWPDHYWIALANLLIQSGYQIFVPWGSAIEEQRAHKIAELGSNVVVLPKTSLSDLAKTLASAEAVVSVDTGLGHLTAALGVPNISLYGPTNPDRVGTVGKQQIQLVSDFSCLKCDKQQCIHKEADQFSACMKAITPEKVFEALQSLVKV